ncbi:MAG: hypothetical protein IT443_09265 [Phycisphaeraceae bacterium]|nr:hypothetical protein [Phycisphaeraceae bacterium]
MSQFATLSEAVDIVNEAAFFDRTLPATRRKELARWIAGRQGLPRGYGGLFAPTKRDFREGLRFFTGESVNTGAGTAHILGEEACRALILLNVKDKPIREALEQTTAAFIAAVRLRERTKPIFCCGKCSVAMWRHLAVGGLCHQQRLISLGLKVLKDRRVGGSKWRTFPFYYTLLALTEIDTPAARAELRYAAPLCEKLLKRRATDELFATRRRALATKVLTLC